MNGLRALLLLLVVSMGMPAGVLAPQVASAAATAAPVAPEDAAAQSRALREAYNLLLDHYVHPLDTAAMVRAAWDNLSREADGKAADPGPAPAVSGDRAADLQAALNALTGYLARPDSAPQGFVAAHALIRGMVHYVNEGHTYFLDPQQYRDYQAWSRGDNSYVGIGVSVSARDGQPRIVSVFEGTPAEAAGLQPGDVLVSIDSHPVAGMVLDQMTALVRGPAGSTVTLVVRRGEDPNPLTFSVQRAEIHLQFVKDSLLQDDIGYVMLRGFPEPSVADSVEHDIAIFQAEGVHGLVLDLRGNSGGRIDVGTRLLSDFLPNGTPVYQQVDRGGQNSTHSTRGDSQYDLPLVVLVDGGTASMGEIFASAVQEHGVATVLGTNTAGSVAAAQVYGLSDGSGLQVTVFEILSSEGKTLNKVGITPDEIIPSTPATPSQAADPVLARAVEILHDQIAANQGA